MHKYYALCTLMYGSFLYVGHLQKSIFLCRQRYGTNIILKNPSSYFVAATSFGHFSFYYYCSLVNTSPACNFYYLISQNQANKRLKKGSFRKYIIISLILTYEIVEITRWACIDETTVYIWLILEKGLYYGYSLY